MSLFFYILLGLFLSRYKNVLRFARFYLLCISNLTIFIPFRIRSDYGVFESLLTQFQPLGFSLSLSFAAFVFNFYTLFFPADRGLFLSLFFFFGARNNKHTHTQFAIEWKCAFKNAKSNKFFFTKFLFVQTVSIRKQNANTHIDRHRNAFGRSIRLSIYLSIAHTFFRSMLAETQTFFCCFFFSFCQH